MPSYPKVSFVLNQSKKNSRSKVLDNKYKQWNAAFDAGYCAALGTPYITLHDDNLIHPLKEVNASAQAWTQTPEQVVDILRYTLQGNALQKAQYVRDNFNVILLKI